jgi:hypothetical protein
VIRCRVAAGYRVDIYFKRSVGLAANHNIIKLIRIFFLGKVGRAGAHQSEGRLIQLYHFNIGIAMAQLRFHTPPLAAGRFIFVVLTSPYSVFTV